MPNPVVNIAIELPTYEIISVRCYSPSGRFEMGRLLLDHYTNPITIFDLVAFGDIQALAKTIDETSFVPKPPPAKPVKKRIVNEHTFEKYDDRSEFTNKNCTDPQSLFLYSYKTNRWEFLDRSTSPPSGWIDLTRCFLEEQRK